MASPEATSKAAASGSSQYPPNCSFFQLGPSEPYRLGVYPLPLSADYRLPDVSQNVQHLGSGAVYPLCLGFSEQVGLSAARSQVINPSFYRHPQCGYPPLNPEGEGEPALVNDFSQPSLPKSWRGGEYPPPLPTDIQGDRPAPYAPPGSPDLPASLQILTLGESARNKEEFEMVDEIWDHTANRYMIVNSPGSAKYPSFVNRRFGKPNTQPECSIDIKSEGLRAIVRQALEDTNNASAYSTLGEEGITVDLDVLLDCLPQLQGCLAIYTGFTLLLLADALGERLKRLLKFLKSLREINALPTVHFGEVDI